MDYRPRWGTDGRMGAALLEDRRSSDSPGLHRLLWVVCGEACYLFIPPGCRCLFRKAEMTDLARLWAWGTRSLNGLKFPVHLAHSVGIYPRLLCQFCGDMFELGIYV
jgi:hypothetical protein